MTTTEHYGLQKPEGADYVSIEILNKNMDIIDAELKKQNENTSNVPNVSTNNQTPTYTVATSLEGLASGEKLSVAMGKIAKAVSSLISHLSDKVSHVTSDERTKWNNKADANHGTHVAFSTTKPSIAGVASPGSATTVSRSDHVHPVQTTISGNAGSATKLENRRAIRTNLASTSTASFDGSSDVTPGVTGILPIANGGTGATTAADALAKLGAAAAAELKKYLPRVGGTLTGDIAISTGELPSLILKTENKGSAFVQAGANDLILLSGNDDTWNNSRRIVIFNPNGRSDVKMAAQLHNVVGGTATAYNLHGGHNKTSGAYTGNGSATSRTIYTGGIGNVVFITSNKGTAILSNGSGITFNSSGVASLLYSAAHFIDGTLTIASTSSFVNASGVTYTYQVL